MPPSEYELVYDLVDTAFGRKRPRKEFDWLYRQNASGQARVWAMIEKATGRFVNSAALFPWPIARGDEELDGVILGDSVTHPDWQRQGLPRQRNRVRHSHPWRDKYVGFSGPNEKSRGRMRKHGSEDKIQGPMPAAAFAFRSRPLLARLGWPKAAAVPVSLAADAALRVLTAVALRPLRRERAGRTRAGRTRASRTGFERIDRFDAGFDPVTDHCMAFDRFWCPHDATFLNWRYLDHPTSEYVAHALVEDDAPIGYTVVRLSGDGATLSELVAPTERPEVGRLLLANALRTTRDAGCPSLSFFAPEHWRHWPLIRQSGFLPYRSDYYLTAGGWVYEPEIQALENWQLVPGDRDYR